MTSTIRDALAAALLCGTMATLPLPAEAQTKGIWLSRDEIAQLPASGPAWSALLSAANGSTGTPDLSNQDDSVNVRVLAKALVFAKTRTEGYRADVVGALTSIVNSGTYNGRALAIGRELGAYAIAADLIELQAHNPSLDQAFRAKIRQFLTTSTSGGPSSIVRCHEERPNNWGTHCGGARAAVAAYLGDAQELARTAAVFRGWLGDRSAYSGFSYGDLAWQANRSAPVGINPPGTTIQGHNVDGVLPDDQRRAGGFSWPPPKENYVYEGLQGALLQAVILHRAGYPAFTWSDQALRRAFQWLYTQAQYQPDSDDTWQTHVINHYYGTNFATRTPSSPGKNLGFTDWTHAGRASSTPPAPPEPEPEPTPTSGPPPPDNVRIVRQ